MRILVTGSSGQIGTNLALRLHARRPRGLRRRQAAQPVDRRLPDPAAGSRRPLPGVPRRDQRGRVPGGRPRRAPRRAREGAPARPRAAPRARERDHDVQRPRVRARARAAARLLVDPRGVRRRSPLRGVRGGGRRLRLHGEPVLGVEDRERGVHLLVRALLRPRLPRLPLLERLRALRQRPLADGARVARCSCTSCRGTSRSRSTAARRRCSTSRTSTTASTGSPAASTRSSSGG